MSKYNLFLITIVVAFIGNWIWNYNPRVGELNDLLSEDVELANYPYQFTVIELKDGNAIMSSPRSAQVSVLKFLSIVKPELRHKDSDSPEVIAAQKELANLQSKAKKFILMQADVNRVNWQIDKSWFASYGVYLD
ncbi:hypothetical protein [Candidatus Marithrix sp. Canyon 246]|uniref:hypothetical protein n=1 Tax=Candidatus Marithrix sp. Canyon 246 TaxID=1827136 RepID=UPI00084A2240|nr:hypothetical protein [Candidatus Marithrix sp. Canyon 246]